MYENAAYMNTEINYHSKYSNWFSTMKFSATAESYICVFQCRIPITRRLNITRTDPQQVLVANKCSTVVAHDPRENSSILTKLRTL